MIDRALSDIRRSVRWKTGICILFAFTSLAVILPSAISSENIRCFGLLIHFLEINIQNIRVVYPQTVIFSIKENCYSRKSRESYALRS